jgi:hypothetical protein
LSVNQHRLLVVPEEGCNRANPNHEDQNRLYRRRTG